MMAKAREKSFLEPCAFYAFIFCVCKNCKILYAVKSCAARANQGTNSHFLFHIYTREIAIGLFF